MDEDNAIAKRVCALDFFIGIRTCKKKFFKFLDPSLKLKKWLTEDGEKGYNVTLRLER